MTIAISIKVFDGLVLAADSAAAVQLIDSTGSPAGETTVYNNANKVFNLHKGLPIGAVSWGLANIGVASIATLMKDLRARLTDSSGAFAEWVLDPASYTIEEVAQRLYEFIYQEQYVPTFQERPDTAPSMGFIVCGYSSGEKQAEEFVIEIGPGDNNKGPVRLRLKEEPGGISWNGQPEAIYRLLLGYGSALPSVLEQNLGVSPDQISQVISVLRQSLVSPLISPGMPIQDAIDLADFLANLTAQYSRFMPGQTTVGGPIELAAITRHEGFRWVRRKHYYHRELNPEEGR